MSCCGCGECGCRAPESGTPPGLTEVDLARSEFGAALERMRRRLSAADLPALRGLTARALTVPLDPAMALLDAWACLGHVLGFYTDRLVNEHYLRTCRELRSATGLARLVGYATRPGLAADVYLAFTLDDLNKEATLAVPAGTRAYSQPGPGETMQPFETDEALAGRPRWNVLRPRLTEPARVTAETMVLDVEGITTGLAKGSKLLVSTADGGHRCVTVASVQALPEQDRSRVWLEQDPAPPKPRPRVLPTGALLSELLRSPAAVTTTRDRLVLRPEDVFTGQSYAAYGLLENAYPGLRERLGAALGGSAHADPTGYVTVRAMRVRARLHGSNAPLIVWEYDPDRQVVTKYKEWDKDGIDVEPDPDGPDRADADPAAGLLGGAAKALDPDEIALDGVYDGILPDSLVVIETPPAAPQIRTVKAVRTATRVNFNMPVPVTVLRLAIGEGETLPRDVRRTVVHAQPEPLRLAEVAITGDVCAGETGELELDGYHDGLHPGRRVIVTGERTDLLAAAEDTTMEVTGVPGTELLLITKVEHRVAETDRTQAGGDTVHTVLTFAEPGLQYCYRRATVAIHANVAHATHGESRAEVLGGGDATMALQTFTLKQGPLTYVSAATAAGSRSTLEVRVDDLRWTEMPHAAAIEPGRRGYLVQATDDKAAIVFGLGARLPTGVANVRALYRTGLGRAGNVRPGQLSVLASRPNGVTAVTNPLAATGGVERDDADAVRRRAPIGLAALDRLVSATDVADFARAFAGIGKAAVTVAAAPHGYLLSVAGADDAPLTSGSVVVQDLRAALARFGDLENPGDGGPLRTRGAVLATIEVRIRTALLLGVRARIRLAPDHLWEAVRPRLEQALHAAFGFTAAELGVVPRAGTALAVMQGVRGVAWVDLLAFGVIPTGTPEQPRTPEEVAASARELFGTEPADPAVGPGEIAYLSATAPGTLLLELAEEAP